MLIASGNIGTPENDLLVAAVSKICEFNNLQKNLVNIEEVAILPSMAFHHWRLFCFHYSCI